MRTLALNARARFYCSTTRRNASRSSISASFLPLSRLRDCLTLRRVSTIAAFVTPSHRFFDNEPSIMECRKCKDVYGGDCEFCSDKSCEACNGNLVVDRMTGMCEVNQIPHCKMLDPKDGHKCAECNKWYSLTPEGHECVSCKQAHLPEGCDQCAIDHTGTATHCLSCVQNLRLDSGNDCVWDECDDFVL